jgi:hypothetical protein
MTKSDVRGFAEWEHEPDEFDRDAEECSRDSDGTATAAANGDLPVPQDCQARAERHRPGRPGHSSMTLTWPEGR